MGLFWKTRTFKFTHEDIVLTRDSEDKKRVPIAKLIKAKNLKSAYKKMRKYLVNCVTDQYGRYQNLNDLFIDKVMCDIKVKEIKD